jgi:hypothetical protein
MQVLRRRFLFLLLTAAAAAASCAGPRAGSAPGETTDAARTASLARELTALGAGADGAEALRLAHTAVATSRALADRYRVVPPALFHNMLVQLGIRDRGLCFHWTEDLMKALQGLGLQTFDLHWGVAHKGSSLQEHNSVVVTLRGRPFETGVVLDPWRHSGELYWAAVRQDGYPWVPLPRSEW